MNPTLKAMMRSTVATTIKEVQRRWAPAPKISTRAWARKYRYLSELESQLPGKYNLDVTPYLAWENGPLDAIDDPTVRKVVGQKSAQIAWTSGVIGNALAKWVDSDPSPILGLFPKEASAKEYMAEKFEPMVDATPRLRGKIDLRSRKAQQRQLFKRFPGGFLKLVGSNSPSSVKSTPTPRVFVEEPDDCNLNLRGQGDSIKLAEERVKTYARPKLIIGGTPTIEGVSAVVAEMENSDKRQAMIPCGDCGEAHPLDFENLRCLEDPLQNHPIFGTKRPETSYYACPACGSTWNDAQKNRYVRKGSWVATAPFRGVAGFYFNELMSPFPGSRMSLLMEKWLTALHDLSRGDAGPLIAFVNSSKGLPYTYKGDMPTAGALQERELDYEANTVPIGGLILVAGIDIQHDRIEVVLRAYGRGEESWLVQYIRIFGTPGVYEDPVWADLDAILFHKYRSVRGFKIGVSAVSLDTSDGTTSDATYKWVRNRQRKGIEFVMAIKGSSLTDSEIFARPVPTKDTNRRNTKAAKYGLQVFIVGTSRAKDLLIGERGRVSLEGDGPGRFHTYRNASPEYYSQLLESEVKAPVRTSNGHIVKAWQKKIGRRNEVLDCEVYALHASRAAKVHLRTPAQWSSLEAKLSQAALFDDDEQPDVPVLPSDVAAPLKSAVAAALEAMLPAVAQQPVEATTAPAPVAVRVVSFAAPSALKKRTNRFA
ncbi:phage terminase large subunit (GpA) [Janthinobacterium sp. HH103]|nr:phage terminase large subunit (GpA) [Janthinobacterium sp. HH100]OEZ73235.1 phage terminase large subunit (GpA) [Janthinobacterium sp. HH100]OEZ88879.1 phage terminase large subunit (GpA) [Janthinobacterium sp. HH103]QOU75444.1 Phage terminase large subunit (GpA) [Janthinobacterium sp. HH102]